jgi:hypothetical protein
LLRKHRVPAPIGHINHYAHVTRWVIVSIVVVDVWSDSLGIYSVSQDRSDQGRRPDTADRPTGMTAGNNIESADFRRTQHSGPKAASQAPT